MYALSVISQQVSMVYRFFIEYVDKTAASCLKYESSDSVKEIVTFPAHLLMSCQWG